MRLYVIGVDGQIARALREAAAKHPDVILGYGGRPELDIRRPELIEKAIAAFSPDIVINPAAYTAVDQAETESDLAFAVNRDGAGNVAAVAAQLGVPIIHLSTDYVFDGKKPSPYLETDSTAPIGVYGQSKLAGEYAVAAANNRHLIFRTSWIFAPFGNNFLRTILRLSDQRDRLRVVDDQIGCPTYSPDVADAIIAVARQIVDLGWQNSFAGVTHLAGPDEISWYGFARKILQFSEGRRTRSIAIDAISTADYPTAAHRPANSRLCCDRLASIFRVGLPPLESALERCLKRLFGTPASDMGTNN
jgi:dTDP-4-dehydrorhamnose reductase